MTSALTIAHVLVSYGMGGAERVALDLAIVQQRFGHRVFVVSLSPDPEGPLAAEYRAAGISARTVAKRPGIDFTLPFRVARLLRTQRVDVLHTHNSLPLIYAAPAGRILGIPVIYTKHGQGHNDSRGDKLLRRLASPCVQSFVAVSETTAQHAREQRECLLPGRLEVIANGIRLDRFGPNAGARRDIRRELGVGAEVWLVGTIGRFDDNKNQSSLVRAVAPLLGDDFQLVLVGDGPSMDTVKQTVTDLARPELVHVLGRRTEVSSILAALDVFALPSLSEGLPLVIPEAMASALPVVSTAVGGIPHVVVDGETGYLVPAGDENAMRERLSALANHRERATELGRAGRERALQEYSAERMTRQYMELYDRALARRRRIFARL
ncbi:MAG: glycosyltransferase [Proteobacteria bacterium]|nr:glycosyltransferase [Pseudomonadota bacterium]